MSPHHSIATHRADILSPKGEKGHCINSFRCLHQKKLYSVLLYIRWKSVSQTTQKECLYSPHTQQVTSALKIQTHTYRSIHPPQKTSRDITVIQIHIPTFNLYILQTQTKEDDYCNSNPRTDIQSIYPPNPNKGRWLLWFKSTHRHWIDIFSQTQTKKMITVIQVRRREREACERSRRRETVDERRGVP